MNDIITVNPDRDIRTVTTEIRTITRNAQQMLLSYAIEIGRRLTEAKEMVPHGEWGDYLKNEVEFSQSSANNFMRLFEEYGNNQQSLFSANSQALGNLSYTKALRLLAVPAEDREDFVEQNNVEDISTRELDRLIKERDDALEAQKRAEERAKNNADYVENARDRIADLACQVKKAEEVESATKKEVEDLRSKYNKAKKELSEIKKNPKVPENIMAQLRKEAEEKAATEAAEKFKKKLEEAEAAAKKAAVEKADAEAKLEAAKKSEQLSNPDAAVFKALFEQVQADFNKLTGVLLKVKSNDTALGEKLVAATTALLDKMRQQI